MIYLTCSNQAQTFSGRFCDFLNKNDITYEITRFYASGPNQITIEDCSLNLVLLIYGNYFKKITEHEYSSNDEYCKRLYNL